MEVTKKEKEQEKPEGQEANRGKINPALIEELMKDYREPSDLTGPGGIIEELHKGLYERVLGTELTHHLGYAKGEAPKKEEGEARSNHRNGSSKKTLVSEEATWQSRCREIEPESLSPNSSVSQGGVGPVDSAKRRRPILARGHERTP